MIEKTYQCRCGTIHYYVGEYREGAKNLVFLPGLGADHRLFDKQVEYFKHEYNVLVWDAPGHLNSRPFTFDFEMKDKAIWLKEILTQEGMEKPVLIGQSMGGYIAQMYMELYPEELSGFICLDSAPLQKSYMTGIEIWLLDHIEPVYALYPWKLLLKQGSNGVAVSEYGKKLMRNMMEEFNPKEYVRLAGHGYHMLAKAANDNLPYKLSVPTLLVCGQKDNAGSSKFYNRRWAKKEHLRLEFVSDAGHNCNTDQPELINALIESWVKSECKR